MAGTLQDQLLKAGLVNKDKAKAIGKEKRKEAKAAKGRGVELVNEAREAALRAAQEKADKDRALNASLNEAAQRKAINAQIKQLIDNHGVDRSRGDISFNFTDGKKVKTIYVDTKQQNQLSLGLLQIAKQGDQYVLIPSPIADKIAQRDANRVINCRDREAPPMTAEEEEWYKDFDVPDDLMW